MGGTQAGVGGNKSTARQLRNRAFRVWLSALLLVLAQGCKQGPSDDDGPGGGSEVDASSDEHDGADEPLEADGGGSQMEHEGSGKDTAPEETLDATVADLDAAVREPEMDAGDASPMMQDALDLELRASIAAHNLTGDAAAASGLKQTRPSEDPLVRLGQLIFFSQTMAGGFDSSCGTCHEVDLGGSDGLSISVGVVPVDASAVGPGRRVDPTRDLDPLADGGPNMHRNSLTTFNSALLDRGLLADQRVFVIDDAIVHGGKGQSIRTPETFTADYSGASGLLETMTKLPLVNDNEMKGFMYTEDGTPDDYRARLVARLRGATDTQYMTSGAAGRWLSRFRAAFHDEQGSAENLITMLNMTRALSAFVSSQIFVDSPWKEFVEGDDAAISADAKHGALLFLNDNEHDGLGCVSCHSGDRFTDESFANVGFPQIGRGFRRSDRRDVGRWLVTRKPEDWMAFRVPNMLNVALTAPYGHAGEFETLEQVIRYHADPRSQVEDFDFSLQHLAQFKDTGITYGSAEKFTREAIAKANFESAEDKLPARALTDEEVAQLVAFLSALSDECANDAQCRSAWTPDASMDPDGHLLVRNQSAAPPIVVASRASDYPARIDFAFTTTIPYIVFPDTMACPDGVSSATNQNMPKFSSKTDSSTFGLTAQHGFAPDTWFSVDHAGVRTQHTMVAGGVTATYLDDDCWPDLAFAGGDASGLVFYRNRGQQQGFEAKPNMISATLRAKLGTKYTGFAAADLDGDYRRELLIGNLEEGELPILSRADLGTYYRVAALPMSRNTYGMAVGMFGTDSFPSVYLGHWSGSGTPSTAPAFFRNLTGWSLTNSDAAGHLTSAYVDQTFNFTPGFVDVDGDGRQDILVSSDFKTSAVLRQTANGTFDNVTQSDVITDENGMGAAIADFDNDGRLDWFVTSILDPSGHAAGNWGVTGNRLYRNVSTPGTVAFEDVTENSGVRDGAWGWGACAADFNQDGFIDIFHVDGFGYIPDEAVPDGVASAAIAQQNWTSITKSYFQGKPSRLFINQGNGTFKESATDWKIDAASEGRGGVCFDSDRDGDIDVSLVDQSKGLQFYQNEIGHDSNHRFLNVRVVGKSPNTEALGARVTVVADVGLGHGTQSQVRVASANSNFNSQNLPNLHFGLGAATKIATLTVRWPGDATPLVCNNVAVNKFLVFDQRVKICPL